VGVRRAVFKIVLNPRVLEKTGNWMSNC